MSIQLTIISLSVDGTTVLDLSAGFTIDPDGSLVYSVLGPVGLLDLQTVPGIGVVDVKIERFWVTTPAVDADAFIVYPGGGTQQFLEQAGTFPRNVPQWAVLMPLGTRLSVDQAAPAPCTTSIHLLGYSQEEWFRLQAGHRFCPRTMQNHFNQADPVPPT